MGQQKSFLSAPRNVMTIVLITLFFTLGLYLAALLAVGIIEISPKISLVLTKFLEEKGYDRLTRRMILLMALFFLAWFLKYFRWQGWRDLGLSEDDSRFITPFWKSKILQGLLIASVSIGAVCISALLFKWRLLSPQPWHIIKATIFSILISGLVVALFEEIICRGILFRVCLRWWNFWTAAIMSSTIFAFAHFISPSPGAFDAPTPLLTAWEVYLDFFINLGRVEMFWLRFVNLTLLGMVFCAFLRATGSVWLGIGAHAGWVWVLKLAQDLTDINRQGQSIWFGSLNDFTDGLLITFVLGALFLFFIKRAKYKNNEVTIKTGHIVWQTVPENRLWLQKWLAENWPASAAGTQPFTSVGGKEFKAYPGCRVAALDGIVIKVCWPRKKSLSGLRFGLRPARSQHNFQIARELLAARINTAEPLAWGSQTILLWRKTDYLLTREIKTPSLAAALSASKPAGKERKSLMAAYGRLAGTFHAKRYSNRDLKYENVMVGESSADLIVLDLDGVRKKWFISRQRARKDLFRIGDSLAGRGWRLPEDIQAFFESYNKLVPQRLHRNEFPKQR